MSFLPSVFAYLGPETMLPMTSVVAGAIGVVMMFGRGSVRWIAATFRRLVPKAKTVSPTRRIGSGPVSSFKAKVRS